MKAQETCSKIGRKELQYAENTGESFGGRCTIPGDLKLFLIALDLCQFGGEEANVASFLAGEIPGSTSQCPNHNSGGTSGKENPREVRWQQKPGMGTLRCQSDEGGEAGE